MKRILSVLLVMMMLLCLTPAAFAASDEAVAAADQLHAMGLFSGMGSDENGQPVYGLDRALNRYEAVTMLVRLLGKTDEALAGSWDTPFTDVIDWAKPYVGYAYANGLASGTSATTFGGDAKVTATQYLTFVLRSLGYSSRHDFAWDKAWELSDAIGLTNGEYNAATKQFLRGDMVIVSLASLSCDKQVNIFADIPAETEVQKANYAEMMQYWNTPRYGWPEDSKGNTLSWDEARALVGQDIETVKKYVKTLEDLLYYLCASDHQRSNGDLKVRDGEGDFQWHFNYSPQVVFENRAGNCGGNAGLCYYLLEGDYDEVGYVGMRSRVGDGGHVINYIKNGDSYYVFDVNQFVGGYENAMNMRCSTDLNEAVKWATGFGETDRERPRMMAYTYTGNLGGDSPMGWPMKPVYYVIDGYSENVNIVYETPEEGYVFEFIEIDAKTLQAIEKMRNDD